MKAVCAILTIPVASLFVSARTALAQSDRCDYCRWSDYSDQVPQASDRLMRGLYVTS